MPLYDYDCANCGKRFEVLRGVHADEPTTCPLCDGGPVKKAFTAPAIHFKGTGWAKKERRATSSPGTSRSSHEGSSSDSGEGSKTTTKDGGGSSESSTSASSSTSGSTDTASSSTSGSSDTASSSAGGSASSTKDPDRPSKSATTKD